MILLCTGSSSGNILQPVTIKPGNLSKMSKLELDVTTTGAGGKAGSGKSTLMERDIGLCSIYHQTCITVIKHTPKPGTAHTGAEIIIYIINK